MKNFLYALRYLLKARTGNFTRVISLALGLGIGFLVFSFVNYQMTFDRFFPDRERIYQLWTNYDAEGLKGTSSGLVGPIGPALAQEMPQIQHSTRIYGKIKNKFYYKESSFIMSYYLVDTSFFSVLDFGVISGDPREIFADRNNVMLSESMARTIFGNKNPVGEILLYQNREPMTVAGIFKDPPMNNHLGKFDLIGSFMFLDEKDYLSWDMGDSFPTYVKLKKGADITQVETLLPDFWKRHGLQREMEEWNQSYFFKSITESNLTGNNIRLLALLLSALGFLAIFIACMNYVLVSISTMVQRSKTIGMLKCNGATRKDIFSVFMWETLIILVIALLLAIFFILALRNSIESVTQYTLMELFAFKRIWVPLIVSVCTFLVSGIIPARLFASLPLTAAFKGVADNRRRWKQTLLFTQLFSVSFVITFLIVILLQFYHLSQGDFGYRYDQLIYTYLRGTSLQLKRCRQELALLPQVEIAALAGNVPIYGYGGMPAYDEKTQELLFSCRSGWFDPHYLSVMGMKLVMGTNFTEDSSPYEVLVNEKYVLMRGWKDSPIGKQVIDNNVSNPIRYSIKGVVKNFRMKADRGGTAPLLIHNINEVMVPDSLPKSAYILIRLKKITPENLLVVQHKLNELQLSDKPELNVYDRALNKALKYERNFRDTVIVVGIITFIIALTGLLGYLADEIRRRSKEIALRKISGARMGDIIRLLARDIAFILLPAIAAGIALGYYVTEQWLRNFEGKILLRWWIFFGAALIVIAIVYAIEIIRTWKIAGSNPVKMLRNE